MGNIIIKKLSDIIYNYDTNLIVFFAIANIIAFVACKVLLKSGNQILNPSGNLRFKTHADNQLGGKAAKSLQNYKTIVLTMYSVYANITAIFPLLGILGTVAALIHKSGNEDMLENLMVALETTLLGVFMAIISKCFDPVLSGAVEVFVEDADYVLRHTEIPEESNDK